MASEVMSLLGFAGLAVGGYVVYQVMTMKFGNSVTNMTHNRIISEGNFFADDQLAGGMDHITMALSTKSTPPRTVRISQVSNHLYNVDIGDGAVFQLDNHGYEHLMQYKHNFNLQQMK